LSLVGVFILVFFILCIINGVIARLIVMHLLRKIHRERPVLYKEIVADSPGSFIEGNWAWSPEQKRIDSRMMKILMSGDYPDIISLVMSFYLKAVRVMLWIAYFLFAVVLGAFAFTVFQ